MVVKVLVEAIGWVGAGLVLFAYQRVALGRGSTGPSFAVMNSIGGACLVLNGAYNGAWPSVGLNLVWVGVGAVSLWRFSRERHSLSEVSGPGGQRR